MSCITAQRHIKLTVSMLAVANLTTTSKEAFTNKDVVENFRV